MGRPRKCAKAGLWRAAVSLMMEGANGVAPQLAGHGGDGVGDRCEVWADARLVCRWLQAPFWCGVVPP